MARRRGRRDRPVPLVPSTRPPALVPSGGLMSFRARRGTGLKPQDAAVRQAGAWHQRS
ncbi:hypothetical protein HY375_00215 [Candidatus Berkelbacteria bacterium]|nr:hypothetical protein [Candidatus Berkelbacteria bacterium]